MKKVTGALIGAMAMAFFATPLHAQKQSYSTKFTRPLSQVIADVSAQFGVRLKCTDVDTAGLMLTQADFRIRPYSIEETLRNILSPFDFRAERQSEKTFKIKPYEYPRRQPEDGQKLLAWLSKKYDSKESWEVRKKQLLTEVRERLEIDDVYAQQENENSSKTQGVEQSKIRKHKGYETSNFRMPLTNGRHICGTIYKPTTKGPHALIICPAGHFAGGRYNADLQKRYATLARMGAICISYDLWGWGESEDEVGAQAHRTDTAHVMQAFAGLQILTWAYEWKNIDKKRVGVNGGSGGGTQAVLLTLLDERFTAACPVVSVSSWFDGGCPCESGKPIQLAAGGTCNAELIATFAPRPLCLVSDGGDWTKTNPQTEIPFIKRIYDFYGQSDAVTNVHLPNERHDFGPNKRQAVYDFFIKTFGLDASKLDENEVDIEDEKTLRFDPRKE